jgi:hypothetical protein
MQKRARWIAMSLGLSMALSSFLVLSHPSPASAASSTAREPAYGLPHIYADTDLEIAREAGREIAKDRLVQMVLFARSGRGSLSQAFGLLDPSFLNSDIATRRTAYTSSELNNMFMKLPQAQRDRVLEYVKGVNDTIEEIYAGTLPEPLEINILRNTLGLEFDLFGNATNISDQVDPNYAPPGGAWPNAGFQYTPEVVMGVTLQLSRQFSVHDFSEDFRLAQLNALIGLHGTTTGTEIWDDLNFLNDPLAPATVPDPNLPGYGGPLASLPSSSRSLTQVAKVAERFPQYDYATPAKRRLEASQESFARTTALSLHRRLASYAWAIGGGKTATGYPWLGSFPQLGIQVPSIPHFMEVRSGEEISAVGGFGVVGAIIGAGHTDSVAWAPTTASLRNIDTFLEEIVNENTDTLRYNDEGTPAPLSPRTETFRLTLGDETRVLWRSHERGGNGGSRPITGFTGNASGTADSGTATTLTHAGAFGGSFVGGHVAITGGTGAGQIRVIDSVVGSDTLVTQGGQDWTTPPDATSEYVAVESGNNIIAVAEDWAPWMEESSTALQFLLFLEADSVLDIRASARIAPTTFNFTTADSQPFNGTGTASGTAGNIGYFSTGFSRVRQDATDPRLPLDGTVPNPLVVKSGTVDSATATTLTTAGADFSGDNFSNLPVNFRYNDPTQQGSEHVVVITGGTGYRQSRRIESNTNDTLTIEFGWGVTPANGDTFEIYEIFGMPEAINPSEGFMANWNGKAATADNQVAVGRQTLSNVFILERIAADNSWDRDKQRQLNKDVAGLVPGVRDTLGRYLVPRLRQAVDAVGNGGNLDVDTVLAALEAHNAAPDSGRFFVDPVTATTEAGEMEFLDDLIDQLVTDIFGDEYGGLVNPPGGGLNHILHAIDSAEGDVPGSYMQAYAGDYFNGGDWKTVVRDSLSALASGGIPADAPRGQTTYNHPLAALFPELIFEPTPEGNRGTYEQITDLTPGNVKAEFVFPLGQSGHYEGTFAGVTAIDPNATSLQPIWRDWRFVPILRVAQDLESSGNPDSDGDGVYDAFERWYFDDTSPNANDDSDGDKASLLEEFLAGTDPTNGDTDDDGIPDGRDTLGQDRLRSGYLKLKGKIQPELEGRVQVTGKIGTSSDFDPDTDDVSLTVLDASGIEIYSATVPAGTMVANASGKSFKFKDNTGTIITNLAQAQLKLSGSATGKSSVKFKTVKADFSSVALADQDIEVQIDIGAHMIPDTRPWEVKGSSIKATK